MGKQFLNTISENPSEPVFITGASKFKVTVKLYDIARTETKINPMMNKGIFFMIIFLNYWKCFIDTLNH
jgi:hypothetical protein